MYNATTSCNENLVNSNRWFIFQDKRILLLRKGEKFYLPAHDEIEDLVSSISLCHEIGFFNGVNCFCAEYVPNNNLNNNVEFITLKQAFIELDNDWFSLLVKSVQIIDWDKHHKYCGLCGNKTTRVPAVFEAKCESCNMIFYPRISPSIIVLIRNKNQILMARGKHFAPGIFGLIAGFVSPGESLEEAVEREVMEEVSIKVKNIRYFGSQPWPFPDSLMVAYTADYESGEIVVDDVEIVEAGWYCRDNLPGMPSSSKSISRKLIENFIAESRPK